MAPIRAERLEDSNMTYYARLQNLFHLPGLFHNDSLANYTQPTHELAQYVFATEINYCFRQNVLQSDSSSSSMKEMWFVRCEFQTLKCGSLQVLFYLRCILEMPTCHSTMSQRL